MQHSWQINTFWAVALMVSVSLVPRWTSAEIRGPKNSNASTRQIRNQAGDKIEMFAAIESGHLEVKLIPKDSTQATVLFTNKTDTPMNVKLPAAFAGLPVLAQNFGGGGMGRGGGGGMGGGGSQGVGGGMGGGGMGRGGGGFGGGGGFFNVAPGKVGKIKVPLVCLEHGKAEPRPRVPYVIQPLEKVTDKPEVVELCTMLGHREIDQRAAQVAAWHLQNEMSWEELAHKEIRHLNGTREPYFTSDELYRAVQVVQVSQQRAESREPSESHRYDSPGQAARQP